MPTPAWFESHARRLWPYRWALGLAALAAPALLAGGLTLTERLGLRNEVSVPALFGPVLLVFSWCWGLTLVGVWFHPERGTMRIGSPWFFPRTPRTLQVLLRWYAAFFLALWFCLPLLFATAACF